METTTQHKKKSQGCFTLKCSVLISYMVSITSNILLSVILYLSDHGYKWPGYFLHFLVLLYSVLSLKNLLNFSNKNLLRYKSMTKYYSLALILTGFFLHSCDYLYVCYKDRYGFDLLFHFLYINMVYFPWAIYINCKFIHTSS